MPAYFRDLNLDQALDTILAGWEPYDLAPYFFAPLRDTDAIHYRQHVMRDLERARPMAAIQAFSTAMREMRAQLQRAEKRYYRHEKSRWFLAAVETYCAAVERLRQDLSAIEFESLGLQRLRRYLDAYARTDAFASLASQARQVAADLAALRYALLIRGNAVTVRPYRGEADASAAVADLFQRFRRGAAKDYRVAFAEPDGMSHVEAEILDRLARLQPEPFAALDAFCAHHGGYLDPTLATFDREVQFYVAYLAHVARLRRAGLSLCVPAIAVRDKQISGRAVFDIALAHRLITEGDTVVVNDFALREPERILVVTGPNQGGKTTFARTIGQLHYLAMLGCLVPGTAARLFLCDRLFTHFERQEDVASLRGKLEDDLLRIRDVLAAATPRSLIIINEMFASTTVRDAVDLSRRILGRISRLDALAVCVTFLDELAAFDAKTVSLVATVDPRDPARRTFTLERRPADGAAYALAIAEKYRVTYPWLIQRIAG